MAECAHVQLFNVKTLVQRLSNVNSRWFELGERLGVKYDVLQGIRQTYSAAGPGELMIHMLEYWFKSNTSCSWNDIIQELAGMDEIALAERLKKECLQNEQHSDLPDGAQSYKRVTSRPSALLPTLPPAGYKLEPVMDGFDLDKYDDLKSAYAHLLTRLRKYLATIDLDEVNFYLGEIFHGIDFKDCGSPDELIKLIKTHIHVFQISPIEQIVAKFPNEEMCQVVETYQQRKEQFLSGTHIADFNNTTMQMMDLSIEKCEVLFNVTEAMVNGKTLKDVDMYARKAFGPFYSHLSEMNKEPGSEFIVWSIPKRYAPKAIRWAQPQLVFLNKHGVKEISVGGIIYSCSHPHKGPAAGTFKLQKSIEQELQLTTQHSSHDLEQELEMAKKQSRYLEQEKERVRVQLLQANKIAEQKQSLEDQMQQLQQESEVAREIEQQIARENQLLTTKKKQVDNIDFTPKMSASGPTVPLVLDKSLLSPHLNFDFSKMADDGRKYWRGGERYHRPYGWRRIALNVEKYQNNTWLGRGGSTEEACGDEWPVSYHGTLNTNVESIARNGYDLTKAKRMTYGNGVYSYPSIEFAEHFSVTFSWNNKTYKVVLQNRVSHSKLIKIPSAGFGEIWLQPDDKLIRPYGVCIKEVT